MTKSLHQTTVHVRLRLQASTLERLERTRKAYCQHALAMVEMAINQGYHLPSGVHEIMGAWRRMALRALKGPHQRFGVRPWPDFSELDVRLHQVTVERLGGMMTTAQDLYAGLYKHQIAHFQGDSPEQRWTLHACAVDALLLVYLKHLPRPRVTPLPVTALPWTTFRDRDKEAHAKAKARTLEEVLAITPTPDPFPTTIWDPDPDTDTGLYSGPVIFTRGIVPPNA